MLLCFCGKAVFAFPAFDSIGKNRVMNIHATGSQRRLAEILFSRFLKPQKKLLKAQIFMKYLRAPELLKLPHSFSF